MAGIGKYSKGKKFTLKSGNNPAFKMMGSSPYNQGTGEEEETFYERAERTKARTEAMGGWQKTNVKSADGKTEEYPMTMDIIDQITRQHDRHHRPESDEDKFVRDTKLYKQKAILTDEEIAARKAKQLGK
tara:strand:+ start:509 stop:898 length:390 start_codon:yes stop_codon:yes gene_type:complete